MLSPYRIQPNNTKKRMEKAKNNFDNNSHNEADVKRPQMTSIKKQKQKTIQKVDLYKRKLKLMNTIYMKFLKIMIDKVKKHEYIQL